MTENGQNSGERDGEDDGRSHRVLYSQIKGRSAEGRDIPHAAA